jgi:surface carbohydrate biosynthesis protein
MKLAAIVDHPQRDLLGLSLVSAHVAARGHQLHLVSADRAGRDLTRGLFDGVLVNYVRNNNARLIERILSNGQPVLVLDTEGGVFDSPTAFGRTLATDDSLLHRLHAYLTWGSGPIQHLVTERGLPLDKVYATGQPRFDVYHEPFLTPLRKAAEQRTRKRRPRMLINFNYPIACPRFNTVSSELAHLVERMGWTPESAQALYERQSTSRQQMLNLVHGLAAAVTSVEFAIRPHPFEEVGDLKRLSAALPNVVFAGDSPIQDWIVSSEVVLQRGCTTAIEATLAGVPALSPSWVGDAYTDNIADKVSYRAADLAEIIDISRHLADWGEVPSQVSGFAPIAEDSRSLTAWMGYLDGRAAVRVADRLIQAGDQRGSRRTVNRRPIDVVKSRTPGRFKRIIRTRRVSALWDRGKVVSRRQIEQDRPVIETVISRPIIKRDHGCYWLSLDQGVEKSS